MKQFITYGLLVYVCTVIVNWLYCVAFYSKHGRGAGSKPATYGDDQGIEWLMIFFPVINTIMSLAWIFKFPFSFGNRPLLHRFLLIKDKK